MNGGEERLSGLFCPNCDYNLTGLSDDRCPECGVSFNPFELQRMVQSAAKPITTATLAVRVLWPGLAFGVLIWLSALLDHEWLFGTWVLAVIVVVPVNTYHTAQQVLASLRVRAGRGPYAMFPSGRSLVVFLGVSIVQLTVIGLAGYAAASLAYG